MKTIKAISTKSAARFLACFYGAIGLVIGSVMLVVALIGSARDHANSGHIIILGVLAPIGLTLAYTLFGYIVGYLMSWLYNFFAKRVGGIQIEVE